MQKGDVVVGEVGLLDEGGWWTLRVELTVPVIARPRRLFGHIDIWIICYLLPNAALSLMMMGLMGVNGICYTVASRIAHSITPKYAYIDLPLQFFFAELAMSSLREWKNKYTGFMLNLSLETRYLQIRWPSPNRTIAFFAQTDFSVDHDDERADSRPLATMSRRQSRIPVDTRQNDTLLEFENCEFVALLFDLPTNTR